MLEAEHGNGETEEVKAETVVLADHWLIFFDKEGEEVARLRDDQVVAVRRAK